MPQDLANVVSIVEIMENTEDSPETGGPQDPPDYVVGCGWCECAEWEITEGGDVCCLGCGFVAEDIRAVFPDE